MDEATGQLPEPGMGKPWDDMGADAVHGLIVDQVPRFARSYVYIRDVATLRREAHNLPAQMRCDFAWSLSFHPTFICALLYEGFLPICTQLGRGGPYVLLPKLHEERCVVDFANLHVTKQAKKRLRKFRLTVNTAFGDVVAKCVEQHGESWLYPPMRQAFSAIVQHQRSTFPAPGPFQATLVSFELWDDSNHLCAGELGCAVGAVYTSFTGFRTKDHTGTVQLVRTGQCLAAAGFAFWDLGQDMAYKRDLGGHLVSRQEFVRRFHAARVKPVPAFTETLEPPCPPCAHSQRGVGEKKAKKRARQERHEPPGQECAGC